MFETLHRCRFKEFSFNPESSDFMLVTAKLDGSKPRFFLGFDGDSCENSLNYLGLTIDKSL